MVCGVAHGDGRVRSMIFSQGQNMSHKKRNTALVIGIVVLLIFLDFASWTEMTPPLYTVETHATAFAWSPQGDKLAIGNTNNVSIWAISANRSEIQRLNVLATDNEIYPLAWNPDGLKVAIGYRNGMTKSGIPL
jgi:WD40 repeat protein